MAKFMKKLPVASNKAIPVRIISDIPENSIKSTNKDDARERKWKAEDALRDLERAEGHKRDKTLMGDVKKLAREKAASLKKLC